jgi:hypothetical protein
VVNVDKAHLFKVGFSCRPVSLVSFRRACFWEHLQCGSSIGSDDLEIGMVIVRTFYSIMCRISPVGSIHS